MQQRFGQVVDDQYEIEEGHRVMNYNYLIKSKRKSRKERKKKNRLVLDSKH